MPTPKRFARDGKMWTYTKTNDGSTLISDPISKPMGMVLNARKSSKTIMSPDLKDPQMIRKRQGIARVISSRG